MIVRYKKIIMRFINEERVPHFSYSEYLQPLPNIWTELCLKRVMKNKRLNKYLSARKLSRNEEIKTDKKTDQDFPGYPHGTASENMITPENETAKRSAGIHIKDGEKMLKTPARKKREIREDESDGSANAFEGTELIKDQED
jgi:hypothetical protein